MLRYGLLNWGIMYTLTNHLHWTYFHFYVIIPVKVSDFKNIKIYGSFYLQIMKLKNFNFLE